MPLNPDYLTLVFLSDTHERHREVGVPVGDVLIFAGDISCMSRSQAAFKDFDRWLGELPHAVKVAIPGNNDYTLEDPASRYLVTNAELLIDQGTEVFGLQIWGSPTEFTNYSNRRRLSAGPVSSLPAPKMKGEPVAPLRLLTKYQERLSFSTGAFSIVYSC
jgi:hypothetical protein